MENTITTYYYKLLSEYFNIAYIKGYLLNIQYNQNIQNNSNEWSAVASPCAYLLNTELFKNTETHYCYSKSDRATSLRKGFNAYYYKDINFCPKKLNEIETSLVNLRYKTNNMQLIAEITKLQTICLFLSVLYNVTTRNSARLGYSKEIRVVDLNYYAYPCITRSN
jgi:hypothetical protein